MSTATARLARFWTIVEAAAWTLGVVCLAGAGAWFLDGVSSSRALMQRFAELQADSPERSGATDVSLWSAERISAWGSTFGLPARAPLGVLRIPGIHLAVPILEGTDDITLNRAVGHVEGTATPGTDGNAAIAGHRDGFFRGLKDVAVGDTIQLDTLEGREVYRIERTWIVSPDDVWVLDATPGRAITLVTCYPFYFVGSAPKRFIVRATRVGEAAATISARRGPLLLPASLEQAASRRLPVPTLQDVR